ncbi:MAG: cation transporter [Desulfovibrionaceae bacterium]|nr:cation transporter [Desulfovibrionaceae bacterium]
MEKRKATCRVALLSLLAAFFLTALKLSVALWTHSLALLSDALHSGLDLLASGMTLFAVISAAKPPDPEHAFGHGKIENISALAQTLLLFATSFWIAQEALERLASPASPAHPSLVAVGIMLISLAIDVNRVRVLKRAAKEHKSQALEADALHFSTDLLSSSFVLIGLTLALAAEALNLRESTKNLVSQADTVAALAVSLIIALTGLTLAKKAIGILIDRAEPKLTESIRASVLQVPGVLAVLSLRARESGPTHFVDIVISVLGEHTVEEAHAIADSVERAVCAIIPGADVIVHVEPGKPST